MIRFTHRDTPGGRARLRDGVRELHPDKLQAALRRLADYEDTGLLPQEVAALRGKKNRLAEYEALGLPPELLAAAREDRLLVLPCPIGGTVWQRYMQCKPDWVPERCDDWRPPEAPRGCTGCPHRYANVTPVTFTYSMIRDFGKFYFATKEEALAGGDGNE